MLDDICTLHPFMCINDVLTEFSSQRCQDFSRSGCRLYGTSFSGEVFRGLEIGFSR